MDRPDICRCYTQPLVLATLVVLTATGVVANDNWPQFRGPNAGVVADDPDLPERWSAAEHVAWVVDVAGIGWGSPIVWDDLIFVTSVVSDEPVPEPGRDLIEDGKMPGYVGGRASEKAIGGDYRWMLYAINFADGTIRWERELRDGVPAASKHPKNTYASETPVTDGQRVYVYHASAGLFAVDFDGNLVWSSDVTLPGEIDPEAARTASNSRATSVGLLDGLGAGSSPTLHDGRLYITVDYESRLWFLAVFDARTGTELWRVSHPKAEAAYGWSTPYIWENDLRTELVVAGDLRVRSYDLDGNQLWELSGLSVNTTPTPFEAHGLLYVASGLPAESLRPVYAIRPGAAGDISLKSGETRNEHVAWYQRSAAPYMPSQLVYGDYLYTLYSQGFLTCHDAKTGEQVYGRQRIARGASGFTASPWAYNGKIFAASEDGDTYVIQAGPEYKLLDTNSLDEMVLATPAVVHQSLIVRTVSRLYRIANTTSP